MPISVIKFTKSELDETYGKADKCVHMTDANGSLFDYPQAFDSTVALDDSQSYWLSVLTNVCSEEWFDAFILSESSEETGEPEKSNTEIWSGELPWSVYQSIEECAADKDEGLVLSGSTTSLRLGLDDAHLCEADVLNENGTTTTNYTKWEPANCGSDYFEARGYSNCDADCSSCDDETYGYICKSPMLIPCHKSNMTN